MGKSINEIEVLEYRLIEAIKHNKINFLEEVIHDDLLGMAPSGQKITKETDLKAHREGNVTVEKIIPIIEEIRIIEDTAIVNVVYDTEGEMFGVKIEGLFKYNRIWKNNAGVWKIIAVTCMKL